MSAPWWSDDDELLVTLGTALREEREVPERFLEAGKAVFAWQSIDAELAALTFDSLVDAHPVAAAARAERATIRELTFASPKIKIHMQVTGTSLYGQIVPAQAGTIEVRTAEHAPQVVEVDEQGWFTVAPVPGGSFRLHCRTLSGTSALTDWLTV
ncbi:MAG: hypothetical protein ACR2GH_19905 [Pseudonocardia sp.]